MDYSEITPSFGVELNQGIQLVDLSEDDVSALIQLAAERGVVVAREQRMDVDAQAEFGKRLGTVMDAPYKKPDFPEGVDGAAFTGLAEGCYEDRAKVSSDFADSMFHSPPSPELKDWLQNMSMESSPQAMADSIEAVGEMKDGTFVATSVETIE